MFWFDRADPRAVFIDNRQEEHLLKDKSSAGGTRRLVIAPDHVADFTALPYPDKTFALVVFDPPHLTNNGHNSWLAKKYGKLGGIGASNSARALLSVSEYCAQMAR